MNFGSYLIDSIVGATTPPGETAEAAATRREAIIGMMQAYNPIDGAEGLIVCNCIMLQFVQLGAMRDANNTSVPPAALNRNRAQAISVSRTLMQWMTKLENLRKRNDAREKEARAEATKARTAAAISAHPAVTGQPPVANGRAAQPSESWPDAAADGSGSGGSGVVSEEARGPEGGHEGGG
jgi:hypothetical protein